MKKNRTCKVEVKKDHLSKISKSTPVQAVAELIWNSLDADASSVDVDFKEGHFGLERIIISDDGEGIVYGKIDELFGFLGGSWKSFKALTKKGRVIHGKEGQGRFKTFTLGRVVEWNVTFYDGEELFDFQISSLAERPDRFVFSEVEKSKKNKTGVEVIIKELHKNFTSLSPEKLIENLLPQFAIYLTNYNDIKVSISGLPLDPNEIISHRETVSLGTETYKEMSHHAELDLIEWSVNQNKEMFYCDEKGFTLGEYNHQIRNIGDFSFSAYLKSTLISQLKDDGLLVSSNFEPSLSNFSDKAVKEIKKYFVNRTLEESKTELQKWKDEEIYPYKDLPDTPVETAERKVFDIVAINVKSSLPDFDSSDKKSRAFQLRMLRQAIEKSPEELQTIVNEVLQLPKNKQAQLAELLQEVSLTSIISASRLVSDRLKFISGLEHLLYDQDTKKHLKERTQLHRILAENTWVFGDSFSLSVDDQSLTEVLRKHAEKTSKEVTIDSPVKRVDGKIGIVDLMLSRTIPRNHSNEFEHLIVELKAPKVVIGEKQIQQIESYAFAVAKDERFKSLDTRWNFWIISNDYNEYAEIKLEQAGYDEGVIFKTRKKINVTIWVKTWSQLIQEVKHRLEFIRDKLNYNIDKTEALKYLKDTYSEFTKGLKLSDNTEK